MTDLSQALQQLRQGTSRIPHRRVWVVVFDAGSSIGGIAGGAATPHAAHGRQEPTGDARRGSESAWSSRDPRQVQGSSGGRQVAATATFGEAEASGPAARISFELDAAAVGADAARVAARIAASISFELLVVAAKAATAAGSSAEPCRQDGLCGGLEPSGAAAATKDANGPAEEGCRHDARC